MLTKNEIKQYALSLSVPAVGVCGVERDEELLHHLNKRRETFPLCEFEEENVAKRVDVKLLMPEAESVLVCLYPYHLKDLPKGNISCYAAVPDYHTVVGEILNDIAEFIQNKEPEAKCLGVCDTSPLVDRWLAYRAGLGFYGKNNALIHPVYGSYFFIGALLLNFPLEADEPMKLSCMGCDRCIKACPGGALTEEFGFDCSRCVSFLTQSKILSPEQEEILALQQSVYGCDVCQAVCPHNQQVPDTPIEAFYNERLTTLEQSEIEALSGRGFKKKYQHYSFSWCSKNTILKNFKVLQKEKQ